MEEDSQPGELKSNPIPESLYHKLPDEDTEETPPHVFPDLTDDPFYEATQLIVDKRRLGENDSGLSQEDGADVVCILHPDSETARQAASRNFRINPRNTMDPYGNDHDQNEETFTEAENGSLPCDLVLRFSANLKEPDRGWVFGRNEQRCDFVLDQEHKVSNTHFRIYLNEHGTIMLEDTSTNGTAVDGTLLRSKDKENGRSHRHMLTNGMLVVLTMDPTIHDFRFIVRVPSRNDDEQAAYEENFIKFMTKIKEAEHRRAILAEGNKQPPNLFSKPTTVTPTTLPPSVLEKRPREWRGGTKYNKGDTIGRGAFAVVHKITDKFLGVPYAAKEIDKNRLIKKGNYEMKIRTEMEIMSKIHHANIVQFVEYIDWGEQLFIIMEYVSGGDLTNLVTRCGYLPEDVVRTMAIQLLDAIQYLHGMSITHRDFKPDNILVYRRSPIHVKITDFGLSKMVTPDKETFLTTFCGTLLYCAPEVYNEYPTYRPDGSVCRPSNWTPGVAGPQRYTHAVDIWSLACVLFYSLCGSPPYQAHNGTTHQVLLHVIMSTALDIRPLQHRGVSEEGIRFVRQMLHVDPHHRATVSELLQSPWITGIPSYVYSDSFDQIDDVEGLEETASQLRLRDDQAHQDNAISSGITEVQSPEIPSSFDTSGSSGSQIDAREDCGSIRNPNENGRLFGEVNMNPSALGSSGVVRLDHVNLPAPVQHLEAPIVQERLNHVHHQPVLESDGDTQLAATKTKTKPSDMAPPLPRVVKTVEKRPQKERISSTSSLMGAELHLGHLRMNSPSVSPSPSGSEQSPTASQRFGSNWDNGTSLRRRREDTQDNSDWWPADLPPPKKRKSQRAIDMIAPPEIFWDPRDKSTHHKDYPVMRLSELKHFQEFAKLKGEEFQHGNKTFEETMHSFRSSRSPSMEATSFSRAQSDPSVEDGRRQMLKRDERRLSLDVSGSVGISREDNIDKAESVHKPVIGSESTKIARTTTSEVSTVVNKHAHLMNSELSPVAGSDFHPPNRVLAKVVAMPDSVLPTIVFSITEPFLSWGRGHENTLRYPNSSEVLVPKKAFKFLLYKPGFYKEDQNYSEPWNEKVSDDQDQNFAFYISTKSTGGIYVNNVHLKSHKCEEQLTESKYWGELRNGDIITVRPNEDTFKVRFECFWGKSKQPREKGEVFEALKPGSLLNELELAGLQIEVAAFKERRRREKEENKRRSERKREQQQGN